MARSVQERRKLYRLNHQRAGLCWKCPSPVFDGQRSVCLKHDVYYLLTKRGLTKGVLNPRNKRLRDLFVAFITGRLEAIASGYYDPGDETQRMKDVVEMRLRLNLKWGGFRGADKMAHIVKNFDYRALRERKKRLGQREAEAGTAAG